MGPSGAVVYPYVGLSRDVAVLWLFPLVVVKPIGTVYWHSYERRPYLGPAVSPVMGVRLVWHRWTGLRFPLRRLGRLPHR